MRGLPPSVFRYSSKCCGMLKFYWENFASGNDGRFITMGKDVDKVLLGFSDDE